MSRAVLSCALLWSFAAAAEQPLAVYPKTVHTRIGNDLVVNGRYYRMAYFTTRDSMKTVVQHFEKEWSQQGIPFTMVGSFDDDVAISAFYTREGLMRTVVVRKHLNKTLGITVLRDLWLKAPEGPADKKLPPMEGVLYSHDLSGSDESGATRQRTVIVEKDLQPARSELGEAMKIAGFNLVRETGRKVEGKQQVVIEHSRGSTQVLSTVSELEPGLSAVSQTWVHSDRLDALPETRESAAAKAR